jgi:two-component system response regulator HydG
MRALIIEDDPELRRLLKMSLEAAGIETLTAADGKRGLALMKDTRFDVVVTDILMPTMDGLEVIQAVRAGHKDVKIIAISGGGRKLPGPEVLGMAEMLGADAALTKPFTREELLATVDAVVGNNTPV